MHGEQQLKPEQRAAFVQKGYLIVPGKLHLGMVDELLRVLEGDEGYLRDKERPPEVCGVN